MDNLTTATPAEIDTELAELDYQRFIAITRAEQYQKLVRDIEASNDEYNKKYALHKHLKTAEDYAAQAADLAEQMRPLNDEFVRRGGWTRAFLAVTNGSGGHVHRNRNCVSCYDTTQYAWMTEFSGLDEDEIVDAAGERACTYCYPSAPVEVLNKPTRMFTKDEKEAAERKAALAAKKEAAAKAVVTDPETGKVLFKTERAATNEVASLLGSHFLYESADYHPTYRHEARQIVKALAVKQGVDAMELWTELEAKAATKFRKEAIKNIKKNLAGKAQIMPQYAKDPANWHESYQRIAKEEGLI